MLMLSTILNWLFVFYAQSHLKKCPKCHSLPALCSDVYMYVVIYVYKSICLAKELQQHIEKSTANSCTKIDCKLR